MNIKKSNQVNYHAFDGEIANYLKKEVPHYIRNELSNYSESKMVRDSEIEITDYLEKEIVNDLSHRMINHLTNSKTNLTERDITNYLEQMMPGYLEKTIPACVQKGVDEYLAGRRQEDRVQHDQQPQENTADHLERIVKENLKSAERDCLDTNIPSHLAEGVTKYLTTEIVRDLQNRVDGNIQGDKISYIEEHIPQYLENNISNYINIGLQNYKKIELDSTDAVANGDKRERDGDVADNCKEEEIDYTETEDVMNYLENEVSHYMQEALMKYLGRSKVGNLEESVIVQLSQEFMSTYSDQIDTLVTMDDANHFGDYVEKIANKFVHKCMAQKLSAIDEKLDKPLQQILPDYIEFWMQSDMEIEGNYYIIQDMSDELRQEFIDSILIDTSLMQRIEHDITSMMVKDKSVYLVQDMEQYLESNIQHYLESKMQAYLERNIDVFVDQREINTVIDNYIDKELKPYVSSKDNSIDLIMDNVTELNDKLKHTLEGDMPAYLSQSEIDDMEKELPHSIILVVNNLIEKKSLEGPKLELSNDGNIKLSHKAAIKQTQADLALLTAEKRGAERKKYHDNDKPSDDEWEVIPGGNWQIVDVEMTDVSDRIMQAPTYYFDQHQSQFDLI